jgi:hypothetical protein
LLQICYSKRNITCQIEGKFKVLPPRFIQDTFNKDKFRIVYHDRKEKEATLDECKGLERFMVWEGVTIEKRLSDYYAGRKNQIVEEMINPNLWRSNPKKTLNSKKNKSKESERKIA